MDVLIPLDIIVATILLILELWRRKIARRPMVTTMRGWTKEDRQYASRSQTEAWADYRGFVTLEIGAAIIFIIAALTTVTFMLGQ